jgi:hypothetical protein
MEVFINLTNVIKMQWDGSTMNVIFGGGDNAYVSGEAARKLRTAISNRCVNQVPLDESNTASTAFAPIGSRPSRPNYTPSGASIRDRTDTPVAELTSLSSKSVSAGVSVPHISGSAPNPRRKETLANRSRRYCWTSISRS